MISTEFRHQIPFIQDTAQHKEEIDFRSLLKKIRLDPLTIRTLDSLPKMRELILAPPPPLPVMDSLLFRSLTSFDNLILFKGIIRVIHDEDSIYRKILSCIPLIGIIPAFTNESSLAAKISNVPAGNAAEIIELVSIKNHYKIADIARAVLTVALVIFASAPVAITVTAAVMTGWAYYDFIEWSKNRELIQKLTP